MSRSAETFFVDSDGDDEKDNEPLIISDDESTESFACQFCSIDLSTLSAEDKQQHYEMHFDSPERKSIGKRLSKAKPDSKASSSSSGSRPTKPIAFTPKQNVFWLPSNDRPPPDEFTPSLIPILKHALLKSHAKGQLTRAVLCCEHVVHSTVDWDRTWGCGYRNFIMACTALMEQTTQPAYSKLLEYPTPPGIRNLQLWIEEAWRQGFDQEGAKDLKHRLVGRSDWIGTAELFVAFSSRGIPAKLADFRTKPKSETRPMVTSLLSWIETYFNTAASAKALPGLQTINNALRGASPVVVADCMPLVLQHQGHSRMVVGYEKSHSGVINLLIFDPSKPVKRDMRNAAIAIHKRSKAQYISPDSDSKAAEASTARQRLTSLKQKFNLSNIANKVIHPHTQGSERSHQPAEASSSKPSSKKRVRRLSDSSEEIVEIPSPMKSRPKGKQKQKELKRVRGGLQEHFAEVMVLDDSGDDVVEIQDAAASPAKRHVPAQTRASADLRSLLDNFDEKTTIKHFRLGRSELQKKDRYQILHFPLTDPLTKDEQLGCHTVNSSIISS